MILLTAFLILVPCLLGCLVRKLLDRSGRGVADAYICGVMTMLIISGLLHFVVMYTNRPFTVYLKVYSIIIAVPAVIGALIAVSDISKSNIGLRARECMTGFINSLSQSRELRIFSALTLIVILLCMVRIITNEPDVTGDFTLETIRTTLQTDSIYQYNSLTGQVIEEGMPIRQQILTMPFFQTFLSRFSGIDISLLLYKIFPCYTLLLTVLTYSRFAQALFPGQNKRQMIFMFIISFMLLVGDYSKTAPAALILHQGFTGNALCAGVIIPFAIYSCMNRKWLLALLCAAAEMFLIWTTYGLGFSMLVIFFFAVIEIAGKVIRRQRV